MKSIAKLGTCLALALLIAACGSDDDDDATDTGLDESAEVSSLDDDDLDTLCDTIVAVFEDAACEDSEGPDHAECVATFGDVGEDCTATVGNVEGCLTELAALECDEEPSELSPDCEALAPCLPDNGDMQPQ